MVKEVEPVQPVERIEEIVRVLDMESVWRNPAFNDTNYDHAYPVFEALYRWTARGAFQLPGQQTRKAEIERAAVETWAARPLAAQLFIGRIAMIQSIPAYGSLPISRWPLVRLKEEWARLTRIIHILGEIRWYLGVGSTANTLGSKAAGRALANANVAARVGEARAARAAMLLRASGAVGLGVTILSGVGLTIAMALCNAALREIDSEIEEVRIPKGELTLEEWALFEHENG
ncbi:hypothetical protein [Paracoccus methylarcula]|uniref:hypothetical protein n=1 Tax=Paracoccus methylarcula TaxID=72022 RepID=UPI0011CD9CB3|nr:hypothetical protein [Paracoccus methylarcula]